MAMDSATILGQTLSVMKKHSAGETGAPKRRHLFPTLSPLFGLSRMECVESGGMLEYLSDVMLWFVLPVDSAFPLAGSSMMMQVMSSWLSALPHNSGSMSSNRIERMELSRTRLRDSQTAEVPFMTTEVSSRISAGGTM